jgi:serine/threonine-protein kinase
VTRALAIEPAQRYQTALELARDLDRERSAHDGGTAPLSVTPPTMPAPHVGQVTPPVEDPTAAPPRRQPRRPWVTGAVAVVVLIAALIAFRRVRPDSSVDDDLLAVAPFSLFGADTVWREGLTDVLVRNLDGAGSLRTVSTATSLQHWNGYSDPTSAENLGRALRSRFVVFGSVMRAGRDSVRVTAAVMDVRERHALPALQWTDASTHMDRLSDSVTLGMLRQIGQQLGVRSLNHIPLGSTTTLAALKEFLQGERYFRRTAWDSAFASYKRATELDSTFALALWRAGVVAWWRGPDEESNDFKRRAGAHNHGLGPRDSLLIAADYLFADADSTTDELRKWNLVRQMHATLAETVRRYPNDAEVWFAQGDALFHFPSLASRVTPRALLAIFQHAIALDSSFAPPYLHAIEVAFQLGNDSAARRSINAYLALQPSDYSADAVRMLSTLLDHGVQAPESQRALANASLDGLATAYQITAQWPDSAELSLIIGRQTLATANARGADTDRADARFRLAHELEFRGHLRDAYRTLTRADVDSSGRSRRMYGELALLGVLPADSIRATLERWRRINPLAERWLLPWLARERDSATIRRVSSDAATVAAAPTLSAAKHSSAQYNVAASQAYLVLAAGDTAGAVRLFDALPDSLCAACYIDRWMRLQLLRSVGRADDAARRAIEGTTRYAEIAYVLFPVEQARSALRLRDFVTAKASYGHVLAIWRRPDPELEPIRREAQDALRRLGGPLIER